MLSYILVALACHVNVLWRACLRFLSEHSIDQFVSGPEIQAFLQFSSFDIVKATAFGYKIWNNTNDTKEMIEVDFDCNSKNVIFFSQGYLQNFEQYIFSDDRSIIYF